VAFFVIVVNNIFKGIISCWIEKTDERPVEHISRRVEMLVINIACLGRTGGGMDIAVR
jgi:hypothetical protein